MLENLLEGLTAMSGGMVTVFVFLSVLYAVVLFLGKIVKELNKLFPENGITAAVKNVCDDTGIAVAIAAAKLRK